MLSKSDTSDIVKIMTSNWPEGTVSRIKNFTSYEVDSEKQLLVSDDFCAAKVSKEVIVPFLGQTEILSKFPSVIVDMGAIKFVCNGAKVLRPGIVEFGNFKRGDIVTVRDQQHRKPLAVAIALEDSDSAKTMTRGYVLDNVHYVSDKIWELAKQVKSMNP